MAYKYSLGGPQPHVEKAAYIIGPMFGINTIYGRVPGQFEHPKGLALDFMTPNKGVGDRLAAYAIANASSLSITQVIWYRQIWTPSRGWHPYSGASDHTDHVHLTFAATPGSGGLTNVGFTNVGLPGSDTLEKFNDSLKWLTDKGNWQRVGVAMAGILLVTLAVVKLVGASSVVSAAKDVVK